MTLARVVAFPVVILVIALGLRAGHKVSAAEPGKEAAIAETVSYYRDVRPVFQQHCQGCHQPAKAGGEFVMVTHAGLLKAGESGAAAVVPGKPEGSKLFEQITPHA